MRNSRTPSLLKEIQAGIRSRFPLIDRDARGHPRVYLNSGAGSKP
jgi:hypothetical protein